MRVGKKLLFDFTSSELQSEEYSPIAFNAVLCEVQPYQNFKLLNKYHGCILHNVQILPMVGITCTTAHHSSKLNSSAIAQWCNVCPTIGNILLAAVNFKRWKK